MTRICTPTTAIVENRTMVAPPSTAAGMAATTAPTLGIRPRTSMNTPAAATIQREVTRVSRSSPTFCE